MSAIVRVMAAVDFSRKGDLVAERAWDLAVAAGAKLIVVHVLDFAPWSEDDGIPFLTPGEREQAYVRLARRQLVVRLAGAGLGRAIPVVVAGPPQRALSEPVLAWCPEVIVVGSHALYGLGQGASFDADGLLKRQPVAVRVVDTRGHDPVGAMFDFARQRLAWS